MKPYDHKEIEDKWQKFWSAGDIYSTRDNTGKPKTFVLDMFPYPSGEGLHVGHPKGYIATDIYSRMKRMQGHEVLHPMGWDAFGLPAENFALKHKVHPRAAVEKNIANFKQQLAHIGFDYDWNREINTTDPEYYKWTQWIFVQLFKKGLAFQSNEPINWCPSCKTGLANEDLDGDKCERCDSMVEKKQLPQWVLKITAYADRMLADLDTLQWPEHIKEAQRNWIGRSEGAEIDFRISGTESVITVFTTRPDTLFGATYMVLAPEHPLVVTFLPGLSNAREVEEYVVAAARKNEIERSAEGKEKTGVRLEGIMAINPANGEEIPIFIADYVLGSYGTGAIMAVPAHDERDFEFAKKFNVPIRRVVEPVLTQTDEPGAYKEGESHKDTDGIIVFVKHWSEDKYIGLRWKKVAWGTLLTGGVEVGESPEETALREVKEETGFQNVRVVQDLGIIHSKFYHVPKQENRFTHSRTLVLQLEDGDRLPITDEEAEKHGIEWFTISGLATFLTAISHKAAVQILSQEGLFSGEGILTHSGSFSGMSSVEARKKITEYVSGRTRTTYKIRDWVFSRQRYWGEPIPIVHCVKCGAVAVPESELPVLLPEVESYEPSGTGESPLANISGWVNTTCPECGGAAQRETNTMPQWAGSSWYYLRFMDPHNSELLVDPEKEKYWAPVDVYVGGDHAVRHLIYARFWHKFLFDIGVVTTLEPFARLEFLGFILAEDGRKMSKRLGNIINPDEIVGLYGADSFRVYEMFMGPFENTVAWSTENMIGARRFIERAWKLQEVSGDASSEVERELHKTIKKVGEDIEHFKFNTAVSQMMIFVNTAEEYGITKEQYATFLKVLAPFAPHMAEELWATLGNSESVHKQSWPDYDEAKLVSDTATIAVQVNGKLRATIDVLASISDDELKEKAKEAVAKWIEGGVKKEIVVPGKLVNFVV